MRDLAHCRKLSKVAGAVFGDHDDTNDKQEDSPGAVIFVAVHRGAESRPDAAGTDDADHRALAKI